MFGRLYGNEVKGDRQRERCGGEVEGILIESVSRNCGLGRGHSAVDILIDKLNCWKHRKCEIINI